VNYLQTPDVQRAIMRATHRRPDVSGVPLDPGFGQHQMFELPFPTSIETISDLTTAYVGTLRRPARTVYVLDISSSMAGHRLSEAKAALERLTESDAAFTSPGTALQPREEVAFVPFSTAPRAVKTFTVPPDDPATALRGIRTYVSRLSAGGQTALYDALADAYQVVRQQAAADPYRITSIVLLSDGGSNTGHDLSQFTAFYRGLPRSVASVPVYPILSGQSADAQMRQLAKLTGGRVFDGRTQPLTDVLAQIRGSQ
jgi:Ca-activated chloride channel family protein